MFLINSGIWGNRTKWSDLLEILLVVILHPRNDLGYCLRNLELVRYCFGHLIFTPCWASQSCVAFVCTTSQGMLLVIGLQLMRVRPTLYFSYSSSSKLLISEVSKLELKVLTAVHTKMISFFYMSNSIDHLKYIMMYHVLAWQADRYINLSNLAFSSLLSIL